MKVFPIRFTDDVGAMRRFLEALELESTLVDGTAGDNWVSLHSETGGVGLHSTATADTPHAAGSTDLCFETAEPLEAVAERLRTAGFEPVVLDESFGRVLQVVDPDGVLVQVNAAMSDLYGYSRPD